MFLTFSILFLFFIHSLVKHFHSHMTVRKYWQCYCFPDWHVVLFHGKKVYSHPLKSRNKCANLFIFRANTASGLHMLPLQIAIHSVNKQWARRAESSVRPEIFYRKMGFLDIDILWKNVIPSKNLNDFFFC